MNPSLQWLGRHWVAATIATLVVLMVLKREIGSVTQGISLNWLVASVIICIAGGQILAHYTRLKFLGWSATILGIGLAGFGLINLMPSLPTVTVTNETFSTMNIIIIGIALGFIIVMGFGIKGHIEHQGKGAMYAVSIVGVIIVLIVVLEFLFYFGTKLLFGDDAGAVRSAVAANIAKAIDPRSLPAEVTQQVAQRIENSTSNLTENLPALGIVISIILAGLFLIYSGRKK